LLCTVAYLVGSVPFGLLIARTRGVDIRAVGSGNVGASNVARALGKRYAVLVLLLDAGKGAAAVLAARGSSSLVLDASLDSWSVAAVGLSAVAGHVFSLYLRFRGGKGVATALGVAIALHPLAAVGSFAIYLALYLPTRISSVGSLGGALSYCGFLFLFGPAEPGTVFFGAVAAAVIVWRHKENIRRLRSGTELRA